MTTISIQQKIQKSTSFDVVVYGASAAGVAASVAAARQGKRVALLSEWNFVGGMTASGLGVADIGDITTVGGISLEFFQRVQAKYNDSANWKYQTAASFSFYSSGNTAMTRFEPSIARAVFADMLSGAGVIVYLNELLAVNGLTKAGNKLIKLKCVSGDEFSAKVFIDASYMGDLMASAGCDFLVGREADSLCVETINGVQVAHATNHQFTANVDPYVTPGTPASGLCYGVRSGAVPPADGTGDAQIQAYNYRLCLSNDANHRIPFTVIPDGYDASKYTLVARWLATGARDTLTGNGAVPNHKWDFNNYGPFSSDFIGQNAGYPTASYASRAAMALAHKQYLQGLVYFLTNDPSVPSDVRAQWANLGYAADEFTDNGNFPPLIYEREGRRMAGLYLHTQADCAGTRTPPVPIGRGSYNMDSHNVQRYVDASGHVKNEGDVQIGSAAGGYLISYRSLCPIESVCSNLLVCWAVSATHAGFASLRMEPVGMIMGHAAGVGASLAIDRKVSVQLVDYAELKGTLTATGQVSPAQFISGGNIVDPTWLQGTVVDDANATLVGSWSASTSATPYVGAGYRNDGNTGQGTKTATFTATLTDAGLYEVRISYTAVSNRATNVPVAITHLFGTSTVTVDQTSTPEIGGLFHSLGKFYFAAGATATVVISNTGTNGYVIIDAVQFVHG